MFLRSKCVFAVVLLSSVIAAGAQLANFDDLTLQPNSYWNCSDGSGGFFDQASFLYNNFDSKYSSWDGFAVSNINNPNASGWTSQYNSITGTGHDGSPNYAVAYVGWNGLPSIRFDQASVEGLYVTNNTYAYYAMLNGGTFNKKFGGSSGNDPDWFKLTIIGIDIAGNLKGSVDFYLADFRFEDNAKDYIVNTWQYIDLTSLGLVSSLEFMITSSDTDPVWGINTPAYFVADSLTFSGYAPMAQQPGSTALDMSDPKIKSWATGYQDYIVGVKCDQIWQTPELAIGEANGTSSDIVCLGDAGQITMTFDSGISDRDGYDFAVFENSFDDYFLELAYVEVSSDGLNFFRIPNDSLTPQPVVFKYPLQDCIVQTTNVGGLAGKYMQGYGTCFDLKVMRRLYPQLDIHDIKYVRIIDIVGDGSCLDSSGDPIYDPHPTTGSAGFDLDAVAVLNMRAGDLNQDGHVNTLDLFDMTQSWLNNSWSANWNNNCDISKLADGTINYKDFATFANQYGH